jgi:NifU-like protein involved in Fe-S cluster formation
MDYSTEVRQRFAAPTRVGEISGESTDTVESVEGSAEDPSLAVWVRFQIQIRSGTIRQARFRAFGCPHMLAAADRVAAELEGRPVDALKAIDWQLLAQELELPREKFGKLLRIEDALAACHAQAKRKQAS